jgi:hypothetical protein
VHGFEQKFALEDAIGSQACSLEASKRVTNSIPLSRVHFFLPVDTVNSVQTLKVNRSHPAAQTYYDSRIDLYAEWDVDFLKADCMMCGPCYTDEMEMYTAAVKKSPHSFSLSYSPGGGMVLVFEQDFALEDAIGSHACSLEATMRVSNGIPLGSPLLLPVATMNYAQTLKVMNHPMVSGWHTTRSVPCTGLSQTSMVDGTTFSRVADVGIFQSRCDAGACRSARAPPSYLSGGW